MSQPRPPHWPVRSSLFGEEVALVEYVRAEMPEHYGPRGAWSRIEEIEYENGDRDWRLHLVLFDLGDDSQRDHLILTMDEAMRVLAELKWQLGDPQDWIEDEKEEGEQRDER